jgi:hypothetical protein
MKRNKKNQKEITAWLYESLKTLGKNLIKSVAYLVKTYPLISQILQLSAIYFYATLCLMYSVINCLGYAPEVFYSIVPFAKEILSSPILKFLASPEKTVLLYLAAVEIILNGRLTSLIVKYNFVLVFILEMVQTISISLWDLLCHRDLDLLEGEIEFSEENALNFFTFIFVFFFLIYCYCYVHSILFKFVSFPEPFKGITDSAAFWINMKRKKKTKEG